MVVGDGHVTGGEVGVVLTADAERGGVNVETVRAVLADEEALRDDLDEELGRTKEGDRVERPARDVIEMHGCHAGAQEPVDGDV